MSEPYINKKVTIRSPVSKVWNVLVKKQYLKQWIREFSGGNVAAEDWHLNGKVSMTDDDGTVLLEGTITEFEPERRLKIEFESSGYIEEITLAAKGNLTLLMVHAGPVAQAEREQHTEVWANGLNKIKELSETLESFS